MARRPHQTENGGVSVLGCVMTVSLQARFICALFALYLRFVCTFFALCFFALYFASRASIALQKN
jgi:hypothetical protein